LDDPRIQKMYVDAIKWAMGLVDADVRPRPVANPSGDARNDGAKNQLGTDRNATSEFVQAIR